MKIVVSDLTRFKKRQKLCLAGFEIGKGTLVRPLPYLEYQYCASQDIKPGSILEGDFVRSRNISKPHTEDHDYTTIRKVAEATSDEFEQHLGVC